MIQNLGRNSLLILTNIALISATLYSWVEPQVGNRTVKSFTFPDSIPLAAWNQIKHNPVPLKTQINLEEKAEDLIESAKYYQYIQDNITIDVSLFYVVNTRGNLNKLIATHTNISQEIISKQQVKQYGNIGSYSLFYEGDRAYLSSCLNPQGSTTVTSQQFSARLNQVKITPNLIGKWLLGKASIRDRRCLWMHLSLPLSSEVNDADRILENTWRELVQWWIPNFPKL